MAGKLNCPSLHFYLVNTNITYEVSFALADAHPVVVRADLLSNLGNAQMPTISKSTMAACKDGLLLSGLDHMENASLTVVVVEYRVPSCKIYFSHFCLKLCLCSLEEQTEANSTSLQEFVGRH